MEAPDDTNLIHCCFESDLSGLITVCVSQMEFACSHVVCNWRPGGAGEFPLMLCSNKILYSVTEKKPNNMIPLKTQ